MDNFYQQNEGFWEICDKRCLRGFPAKSSRYRATDMWNVSDMRFFIRVLWKTAKKGEDILYKHMQNKKLWTDFDEK